MRLAQLLVACAEAVAPRQRCRPARRAFQRVASFFVQELLDRRASAGAGPCEHGVLHPAVVVREAYAEGLGMYLEFRGINRGLESLHIDDLGVDADEAVAINSSVPIKMAAKAREWLDENAGGDGYTVADEKVCLVLGWKGKPVIAASCWKC
uniref:Uncharacterized protein n=1 Tax=Oryza rufipogon TaxID=4529 RepID=A0A0E0N6E6_ORYRU